jgi:polar amino acid transport system permease protein
VAHIVGAGGGIAERAWSSLAREAPWIKINRTARPYVDASSVIGLVLHEAAYAAEVVRAGILSVDPGQSEAAQALGMTRLRTLRRIVLPQAMSTIVPPARETC